MERIEIRTSVVANTVPVGFESAVAAVAARSGQEIVSGRAGLLVGGTVEETPALSGVTFSGRLRTGSLFRPSLPVDIVVSPWSETRTEIAIRPQGRLRSTSLGLDRYFRAAWPALDQLIATVAGTGEEESYAGQEQGLAA